MAIVGLIDQPTTLHEYKSITTATHKLCIVHMVRNSLNYVGWNKREQVAADLKRVYSAVIIDEAEQYLTGFEAN